MITDKELQLGKWLKGKVIQVFKAADGQVRSAQVKTVQGVYTRPAAKIAILDVRNKQNQGG